MANENMTKKYLVFRLDSQEYGLDIKKITTIIEKEAFITRIPKSPQYISGVINLRGDIIPIMNLRKRLNLEDIEDTDDMRIIVVKADETIMGVLVDAVAEVVELGELDFESTANFSTSFIDDFISGAGKIKDKVITILNLDKLVTP